MTERLTLDRFRELADAYGGVTARWPEADRAMAMRMAREAEAIAILQEASVLDDALDSWRLSAAPAGLCDRVIASAPAPGNALIVRAKLWWSGIGLAAALAGAAAGTAAVAMVPPTDASPESGTSFGDVAGPES